LAALVLLLPLRDERSAGAESEYAHAHALFLHGRLEDCQAEAEWGSRRYRSDSPEWAMRFRLLEANAMVWRGMYEDALRLLAPASFSARDKDEKIEQLTLESAAFGHLLEFAQADQATAEAEKLCAYLGSVNCGAVLRARGVLDLQNGQASAARQEFLDTLDFARSHKDNFLEVTALSNLGVTAAQSEHYDEAVGWTTAAYRAARDQDFEDQAQAALGNLGWAYFQLGDIDRALDSFLDAEKRAATLGNTRTELKWLTNAGYAYRKNGQLDRAISSYRTALQLATQLKSREDIVDSLEVLTHLSVAMENLSQADGYIGQLAPLVQATGTKLDDVDLMLAEGEIAAARRQDSQAQSYFDQVRSNPASQTSMRLGAEHALAQLAERRGDLAAADRMYATALDTFEHARSQLQNEESKLPFLANAAPIYDDYVRLLIKQGRVEQALAVADHSRARTLAAGLGINIAAQPAALSPQRIAQKAGATLLFYWLGPTQSWLWAITPQKTALFPLPAAPEIARVAGRYHNALLGPDDPLDSADADGQALYRMLVAPAASLIPAGSSVVILSDGALNQLNFETLLVPAPHLHYWIEDATVISAPSLTVLASAKPSAAGERRLLLLGDAISPDPDYPTLLKASEEMREIERHFARPEETVLAGPGANPEAYLASAPQQFAYIHFVAHGVASLTDPLDSAIILSPASTAEDSFKLYARSIIQHPIHARLVTISSCYGGGTRTYAGEGLVGLSWAFLHAGAHNVIGALWEVSDDSTPALMDSLYQGLERGLPPSVALRQAKLLLLHGPGAYRNPFYWAPFQLYAGL
jgi:CHAT domain-containing protein